MRKIKSKDTESKRQKRNQVILGVILIFVMFFSVLGYSFQGGGDNSAKIDYNGFEFVEQDSFWILNIGDFDFVFRYNPNQVEKIDSELNYLNSYSGKLLYVSSKNNEATSEIYQNLNPLVERMQFACLEEKDCGEGMPVKTCEDNFIIIRESSVTGITQNQSCVFIEGPEESLVQLTDEFLFKVLGVES